MQKARISQLEKPFICGTLFYSDRRTTMMNMKLGELQGAKAFELNLLSLQSTDEDLKDIFKFTTRPVFTTFRRGGPRADGTLIRNDANEEQRMQRQLDALELSSSGFDMEFDTFVMKRRTEDQWTSDEASIKKQQRIIEAAHARNAEVMISCHVYNRVLTSSEAVRIGKEVEKRGADLAKIVCQNYSYEDMLETLKGVLALRKQLTIPFVYFGMGEFSKLTRVVGPMLGSMLVYATVTKIPIDFLWHQPLIEDMREVFQHVDWSVTMEGREGWTNK
jgi:3-dehydroquinate dehydratase